MLQKCRSPIPCPGCTHWRWWYLQPHFASRLLSFQLYMQRRTGNRSCWLFQVPLLFGHRSACGHGLSVLPHGFRCPPDYPEEFLSLLLFQRSALYGQPVLFCPPGSVGKQKLQIIQLLLLRYSARLLFGKSEVRRCFYFASDSFLLLISVTYFLGFQLFSHFFLR